VNYLVLNTAKEATKSTNSLTSLFWAKFGFEISFPWQANQKNHSDDKADKRLQVM